MRKIAIAMLMFALLLPVKNAFGWGQEGHRIIGQIAYNHLTKKAKKQINNILGEEGIVFWINWADEIKSDTIYPNSYDWHFQDLEAGLTEAELQQMRQRYPEQGGNLWRAMDSLYGELSRDGSNLDALRFLIHITGDFFCPMHTGHLDDLGGNRVKMKWFGSSTNLHSVWDSEIIKARGYSYTEYAMYLEKAFRGEQAAAAKKSQTDYILDNYNFTQKIYAYQETWDGNAYHYVYQFAPQMERQLYLGGLYLARILNELYG